jgi:membrane protein YdbS with pleckstrin-like domain
VTVYVKVFVKNVLILSVLKKPVDQDVTRVIQKQENVPIIVMLVKPVKMMFASIRTAPHAQSVLLTQGIVFLVVLARFV